MTFICCFFFINYILTVVKFLNAVQSKAGWIVSSECLPTKRILMYSI